MTGCIHFAHALDGAEPGAALAGDAIARALAADTLAWVHLSATDPDSPGWIRANLDYLPAPVRAALIAEATRPRVSFFDDGALVILRGVNTNPGADPDDMVSIRLWVDPARIVSLSRRRLAAVAELRAAIAAGAGPGDAGAFLAELVERLNARITARAEALEAAGERIEDQALTAAAQGAALRADLTELRRELAVLRRFLRPQRDAVASLAGGRLGWTAGLADLRLAEAADVLTRMIEDLDGLAERMTVARDEIASAHSDRMNRNLYRLSVISAVFLPLGFLTGLMGVNLGGMPGAADPRGFWLFSAALAALVVALLGLIWRARRR